MYFKIKLEQLVKGPIFSQRISAWIEVEKKIPKSLMYF